MKKLNLIIGVLMLALVATTSLAQSPEAFNYQAVLRDDGGNILSVQLVEMRFTIRNGSASGPIVYQETETISTNEFGTVNHAIGTGSVVSGSFSGVNWSNGDKYLRVELNTGGGFVNLGTQKMQSVPYAMHAKTVTQPTYVIGFNQDLGGVVFFVTPDGKHGLVAETQNQGTYNWFNAQDAISNPNNHSIYGDKFTDWRLPTKYELNLMYTMQNTIGGFDGAGYWSSTENSTDDAWSQGFGNGSQQFSTKFDLGRIRAIREF